MGSIQVPTNQQVNKENVLYICTMEYYSAIKKNEITLFAGNKQQTGTGDHNVK
jgi:hypothetical protein